MSTSEPLGLDVVRFQPKRLQFGVVVWTKLVTLQNFVQLLEVAAMEGDNRLRFQYGLVVVEFIAGRQRPQEPSQSLHIASLLEYLKTGTVSR